MELRNPVFTADGAIDCEINHPQFGWIPFTADPEDIEPLGRAVHAVALEMNPAPYVPPTPEETLAAARSEASASRLALCMALRRTGILTAPEAAMAARGEWIAAFAAAGDDAMIEWAGSQAFARTGAQLAHLQATLGWPDAVLDEACGLNA